MDKDYAKYLLEKTRQDYNLIAEDFSRTRQFFWGDLKFLSQYAEKGDRILDLGCGNGRLVELFKDKDVEYIGVDSSEKLIEAAKNHYPEAKFQAADALNLPFPENFFDKVFSVAVLHHIPSKEFRIQFLEEIKRVLKPKGLLVLTVWNLWQKKTAWKLLFKNTCLKLIGKSKLDFKDIFYPWKNSAQKTLIQRYFHLFNKKELEKLAQEAGFSVKKAGVLTNSDKKESNIYLVAQTLNKK